MKDEKYTFMATIELEYPIPEGSNAVQEVQNCVDYCKNALAWESMIRESYAESEFNGIIFTIGSFERSEWMSETFEIILVFLDPDIEKSNKSLPGSIGRQNRGWTEREKLIA